MATAQCGVGLAEHISVSRGSVLLRDALRPEVHEFLAVLEFDSTFVANTVIAHVGRLKREGRAEPRLGEVGLRKERRWYLPLDEDEEVIVRLREKDGEFRHVVGNAVHLFYGRLPDGHYKAAVSVYKNEREKVTRVVVHSKGEFYDYDPDRPETVFEALFKSLKRFFGFFETRSGVRIDVSRARLYPVWIEQKVRYAERRELDVVRLIRNLGFRYPNHRSPPKSIRTEEHPSYPGTFYLAGAILVHDAYEDVEIYVKSYRIKGYRSPARRLEDHPCLEVKIHWRERRDFLRDEEFRSWVAEDCEKARCFLNEVALMSLDLEEDLLPLREGSERPFGRLYERDPDLIRVLNFVARSPPVRREEVVKHFSGLIPAKEVLRKLEVLQRLGLVKKEALKGDVKGGARLTFYVAALPSYSSEIAVLLKLQSDEVGVDEGKRLLAEIASRKLVLDIVEEVLRREAVTVPLLQRVLGAPREKIRYALERLAARGVLTRYKGETREIYYRFASETVKVKILRVFQAIGYKARELFDPLLTTRFFEELRAASETVRNAVLRLFRKYGELLPLKLEAVLRGLSGVETARDRLKDFLSERIVEGLREKGYVSFRELLDAARERAGGDGLADLVERVMDEVKETTNVLEECNGNRRRIVKTLTAEGLCLVALEREDTLAGSRFVVPERLQWRLKPQIYAVEVPLESEALAISLVTR
mgnify:CR=1 FL=1